MVVVHYLHIRIIIKKIILIEYYFIPIAYWYAYALYLFIYAYAYAYIVASYEFYLLLLRKYQKNIYKY